MPFCQNTPHFTVPFYGYNVTSPNPPQGIEMLSLAFGCLELVLEGFFPVRPTVGFWRVYVVQQRWICILSTRN